MWEKSEFKVTEAGADLACAGNSQEASVAREEGRRESRIRARRRVGGARGGGARGGGARGGGARGGGVRGGGAPGPTEDTGFDIEGKGTCGHFLIQDGHVYTS